MIFISKEELMTGFHESQVVVPPIDNKTSLIECISRKLHVKGYESYNWDSFEEVLEFWDIPISDSSICIYHESILAMKDSEIRIYLDIIRHVEKNHTNKFVFAFDIKEKVGIESL